MYKYNDKARYSLVDQKGNIPPHQILNFFQNCSSEQSEQVGKGVKYMMGLNKAWVLLGYQICIDRPIKYEEEIIVGTEPTGFRGFFGQRNYCIMDKEENYIVKADSLWTLIDMESREPVRITEEDFGGYTLGESFEGIKAKRKLRFTSQGEKKGSFKVLNNYIDNNGHMNNANYLMLASEFLPNIEELTQINIAFIKEALLGQDMTVYVHNEEEGIGVCFKNDEGEELCKILAMTSEAARDKRG